MSTYLVIKTEMAKTYAEMRDLAVKVETAERDATRAEANHTLCDDEANEAATELLAMATSDMVDINAYREMTATVSTLRAVAEGVGASLNKTRHMLVGMKERQQQLSRHYSSLDDSLKTAECAVYEFKKEHS